MYSNVKEREKQIDIERRIDLYIYGKLNQLQIDALWVDLIENPSNFNYLKTTATLKRVLKNSVETQLDFSAHVSSDNQNSSNIRPLSMSWAKYAATFYMGTTDDSSFTKPLDSLELIVYRSGSDSNVDQHLSTIQEAIDLALTGNSTTAIIMLNNLIEQNTDESIQAEALLNIGIIEYNTDDFNAALIALERASSIDNLDKLLYERIMWNLSHTQMALGNQLAAKESIQTVIDLDGAHSRMARNYIKYLK